VPCCQFLKNIMVPGRDGVMDVILSGYKEDLHGFLYPGPDATIF
jgi:hypothetical protein